VLVELTSPLAGLLPGIVISLVIFALGTVASPLWSYRSAPDGVPRYR
jgi:hypothetical protein